MTELGFEVPRSTRSAFTARDASPDSVIFTLDSNFSVFSSNSASVDRCSFASDAQDHDSEVSPHCVGHDRGRSSGTDLKLNLNKSTLHKHGRLFRKGDKAKAHKEQTHRDGEDDKQISDQARSSFSLALKECQEKRSRSDPLSRKLDRQRPSSFDFNNATAASSPRLTGVKNSSMATHRSGAFPSPGTPNYRHASFGLQKGWSSERVPLQSTTSRRNTGAPFLSFNNNGRTLPSKWEDAERWILSPVAGDSITRPSIPPPQRRPKSKSGPLGPPGVAYYSLFSPAMPMLEVGNMENFTMESPFSAGVIAAAADGLTFRSSGYHGGNFLVSAEPCMGRSVSVHGCSEMLSLPSTVRPQDGNLKGVKNAPANTSFPISKRDIATQMSPEGSACSSPERRFSFSASPPPSAVSIVELQTNSSPKLGIKDVPVDEQVTLTRWSKKNHHRISGRGSESSEEWKRRDADAHASAWDISDTARSISRVKREQAKITAWENLQKAKAEASIRKLEMKLEKKKSSSMDKIMKKLRSSQKKAQEMRSSVSSDQSHEVARRTSHKAAIFRRTRHMGGSLSVCFTCHAF